MSSLFGIEASRAVIFVIAFAIILSLLVLAGVVMRKVWGTRLMMPGNDRGRSRQPRLGIVDVYDLDRQRQLLLLRRDNVEHLLLIGGPNDVVIETNIVRVAGARIPPAANESVPERFEPTLDQPQRPAPVEGNGRPSIEAQLAAQLGAFVRRPTSEESDVDQELSPVASISAPIPARPEPELRPDTVSLADQPAPSGLRAEARTVPFPSAPVPPGPATPPPVERPEPRPSSFMPQSFQSRPTPTIPTPPPAAPQPEPEPVRPFPAAPVDKPAAPAVKTGPDAAVLSNMAKQLEEALKRPAPVVAPVAAPSSTFPEREEIAEDDDLLENDRVQESPEDYREEAIEEPEPAPQPEPLRPAAEPAHPAPSPLPPQPTEQAPAAQKAPDPFSVEDIEAEFARLLGRPLDSGKKS